MCRDVAQVDLQDVQDVQKKGVQGRGSSGSAENFLSLLSSFPLFSTIFDHEDLDHVRSSSAAPAAARAPPRSGEPNRMGVGAFSGNGEGGGVGPHLGKGVERREVRGVAQEVEGVEAMWPWR